MNTKLSLFFTSLLLSLPVSANCIKPPNARQFQASECVIDGFAVVKHKGKFGVVNAQGKMVVPPVYQSLGGTYRIANTDAIFHQGVTMAKKNGLYGIINQNGQTLIPFKYPQAFVLKHAFQYGVELAQYQQKNVLLYPDGTEKILPYQDVTLNDASGFLVIRENGSMGLVHVAAPETMRLPLGRYEQIGAFQNGLAKVQLNQRWGYINTELREIIPPVYEQATDFVDNLAVVRLDGLWRIINHTGQTVADNLPYYEIGAFEHGIAIIRTEEGLEGAINSSGKVILEPIYDGVQSAFDNPDFVYVFHQGRYALFNRDGKALTNFAFERLRGDSKSEGVVRLQAGKIIHVFDKNGQEIRTHSLP